MADEPISQEIKLPTDYSDVAAATKKLDELIGRVSKLEHATTSTGEAHKKHAKESEAGFKGLWETMGRVVRREAELAVGIRAIGMAGLEAKGRVGEFLEFIGAEAALEFLKKIGEEVVDIGKESLKSAAMAQRMNFALDAASGGKEAGEGVRKFVEANAKFSEFTEAQNERAFLTLRRFGVGNQKAGLFMKASEDLAAMVAPEDREGVYQESLQAFARVHARGRIDSRSAMRLGIGVEDFASLPQFQGKSIKQIQKALEGQNANVSENDLLNLVVRHAGEKAIGERAADASGLLLTRMTKLSELPERFYKRLGETAAARKLADEIGSIVDKLDPESPTGRKIYGALESTFELIADKVGEIDFDSVADTIRDDVLPAIQEMIRLIGPTLDAITTTVHGLGIAAHFLTGNKTDKEIAAAGNAYNANMTATTEGGVFGRILAHLKAPFLRHSAGLDSDEAPVETPMGTMSRAQARKLGLLGGGAHAQGYAQGIESGSAMSEEAAAGAGEAAHDALMSSMDARSPSRKTRTAGGYFGEGFALGIEDKLGRIDDAIDSTISVPVERGTTSAAGLGRSMNIQFGDINVTMGGGGSGGSDEAGATPDQLARAIKAAIIDAFEEIDAEGSI